MHSRQKKKHTAANYAEEKASGLNAVVQLLVDGGYHRARIGALDPFDKIAGGLAWGILCSSESIDVDFVENANIGQKLKIGENIENALVAMRCPHPLQAYQIQGLDYPNIEVVVRWLLKRVALVRREQEASLHRHGQLCFQRTFGTSPWEKPSDQRVPPPARKYRRPANADLSTEAAHISSVLLEYGHTYQVNADMDIEAMAEDEEEGATSEQLRRLQQEQETELQAMQEMLSNMATAKDKGKVSSSAVGGLVASHGDSIAEASSQFKERMEELRKQMGEGELEDEKLQKKKQAISEREAELQSEAARLQQLKEEEERTRLEVERAQKEKGKKERRLQRVTDELMRLSEMLDNDPTLKAKFDKLKKLVDDTAAAEEASESLRQTCPVKLAEWKKRVAQLQDEAREASQQGENEEVANELLGQLRDTEKRLQPVMATVAKLDRGIAKLQRQIDEIPTRAELSQYELRFTELYEQVSWKFDETKRYYARNNVLTKTENYLQKEADLLASVEQEITDLIGVKDKEEEKQHLTSAIKEIVDIVDGSREKVAAKLEDERAVLSRKEETYNQMVGTQRSYYQGIRDLQDEFSKNEQLHAKLDQLRAALAEIEGDG